MPLLSVAPLLVAVSVSNISLQIFISSMSKSSMIAVLVSVTVWILLAIANMFVPHLGGFIAPFDINSVQANHFKILFKLDGGMVGMPAVIIILLPVLYSAGLLVVSSLNMRRICST